MSRQVIVEVPEDALKLCGDDAASFGRDMYETAVAKWFDEGRISQGRAAELLGISRAELFEVLSRHKVSPIQITPEELAEELKGA
jgi:predicted XRE-type DNA-binding protein